ncbi:MULTISPECIES: D-alanine--D-alanine ligase [unclassified Agarivorans]|uniref:D-alanine--D-alanine ligase n=1 Tax=unclassified Agarivorans TaxID=2636026 RepID=UPI0026E48075|nr:MULTISPECIES: D-alanine--D-alanine ligase [unclassified Agarivorans]MDO6686912.1 D-alanine--D-alanine ligase [Agarivorans sp. 3_MG-2023]MDO6716709.1 D-alanine--D-alanine ligase [Agarivorans sp. 2_MG-2023]
MASLRMNRVAVLFGGDSAEREVSLKSGNAVLAGLLRAGIQAEGIDTKGFDLNILKQRKYSHVFIALHGRGGEDGTLQGALEYLGLPYTGSRVLGSALAMDKIRCKQIWQNIGLPTADYAIVDKQGYQAADAAGILERLSGVVMVKPALEGSSIGMAKAETVEQLEEAITNAFEFDSRVLVEQWITGAEYTVSIVGDKVLPSIRMQTPHTFYDYNAKYQSNSTEYFCPSGLDEQAEQELANIAMQAFKSVDCEGWGRVDFMADQQGNWYLLEVNTSPGMTEKSLVPMAAKQTGINFDQLVVSILDLAH